MWTSTLDLNLNRILLTRLLGLVYPDMYYSHLSPLRVANTPRPALPAANWVRVRNHLAGICGSDLHLIHANADVRTSVAALPHDKQLYPGHEVVGEVIEIGEDVQHLHVGDRVVLQYHPNCLSTGAKPVCRACATGNYNLCEYGSLPGPQPIGAGWSEEMLLHEQQLFRLPIELNDEQGVILEPTSVALHAVLRHVPRADDNVLIIGAGTIGLLTLQMLRLLAPKARISILARYPFQIEHATRLGANSIIYSTDPYASVQRATASRLYKGILGNRTLTGGYDVIYDTVGQQKTLHHALRWLRTQGTMVLTGLSLHMMHIDLTPLWHQEINLLGSLSHGRETWPQGPLTDLLGPSSGRSTFSVVAELMQQKRIQPEQLITHRFALNNYKDALICAHRKKRSQSIKVVFDYALLPVSAVPNVRASDRIYRPTLSQPQGNRSAEEFLQAQNTAASRQEPGQETIPQSSREQQTLPPKILETPAPEAFASKVERTIPDDDEDTDPAIPVIKHAPVSPEVAESPQTPMPPAKGLSTDQPIQPRVNQAAPEAPEAPGAGAASEIQTPENLQGPAPSEVASLLPALDVQATIENLQDPIPAEPISASSTSDAQITKDTNSANSEDEPQYEHRRISAASEKTALLLSTNEDEPTSPFDETTGMHAVTEEQLPTQTVLDDLFDANTSSMPEFLTQLPDFAALPVPETPIENAKTSGLPDTAETTPPISSPEQVRPDQPDTIIIAADATPKAKKKRNASNAAQSSTTTNADTQHDK